jgi:hypothetical protein
VGSGPSSGEVAGQEHRPERLQRFLRAWAHRLSGRPASPEGDDALRSHGLGTALSAQMTADQARRTDLYLRDLAARAQQLAADLGALGAAGDEPTRQVGHRLGAAARAVGEAADEITDAAGDLGRSGRR